MNKVPNTPDLAAVYLEFADQLAELRKKRNYIERDYYDLENEYRSLAAKVAPRKPLTKIEAIWPEDPPRSDWEREMAGLKS